MFALSILAFIFIGLQIRPILEGPAAADRGRYFAVSGAVLLTVILVRLAWQLSFNAVLRWRNRRFGFHPPRPMLQPTFGSGLIISWAGMRGIVSLAAALESLACDRSPIAEVVRQEFTALLGGERADGDAGDVTRPAHNQLLRRALQAARQTVLAMRASDEIGDDAFHQMEEELDWLEMAGGRSGE